MNPIKEFFRKKAADRKFKSAGPAHKLSESSKPSTSSQPSQKGHTSEQHRVSKEAERAAAAALERVQQQKQTDLNWSSQAIKNQARKELELENSLKNIAITPKQIPTFQAECVNFTVSGVYFYCPMIGPDILPKSEIQDKIKSFLYKQLEDEKEIRGLTSCLIIHTLNKNKNKVQEGVKTLVRYLENIVNEPTVEKYRRIKLKNKVFQDRIADLEGAFDFLLAAGFSRETLKLEEEEEEFFVLKDENLDIENLQMLKEAILNAEPIIPVLDRNLKVLRPADFSERVNLPRDFFNLTVDEVKREHETRAETIELMTQLRTKAMREKDKIKERHIYKYSLIRIRFPDGIILQGTFSVYEKLHSVREFVFENLADSSEEFELLLPGGTKLSDENTTLLELELVPAAVLNFHFSRDNVQRDSFLNFECMSLLSDL